MKNERINGYMLDLDKVLSLEYDDDTYVMHATLRSLYCFKKRIEIKGVLKEDYNKLYMKWDTHKKTIIPKIIN